jgi:hypothetical protein
MLERLFVGVLGNRNSGKSTTSNTLFGATVRTGQYPRTLTLYDGECVEVFVISGSPEERHLYAGDIPKKTGMPHRALFALIHRGGTSDARFRDRGGLRYLRAMVKPRPNDAGENNDQLGLMPWLLGHGATVAMRDGQVPPGSRTEEIRQFIHSWAKAHGLTLACR